MKAIRQASLLEVNEFLVLDYIREHGPTTRGQVGREVGISRASVSRIVNRLRRSGEVIETAGVSPRGGRPSDIIEFNYQSGSVIVADIGRRQCHVVVADLVGTITTDLVRPTLAAQSPYETLRGLVLEAQTEAATHELPVSALVVGLPAVLDGDTGAARFSPWDFGGTDLVKSLARDTSLPILLENEANLAALAQAWRGLGRGLRDFAVISIGSGLGGAVVANGQLVKGRNNAAGEVGFLVSAPDDLAESSGQAIPTLEGLVGAAGITRRARSHAATLGVSAPLPKELDPEDIFHAAGRGEEWAVRTVDETLDLIALVVIAISATVNPERVIFDGGVGRSLGRYIERITDRVRPRLPYLPDLRVSELGPNSTVIGGVAAGLELARQQRAPSAARQPLTALWSSRRSAV
jgi:predicted NBD/HSP70 family sugar kinase